MISLPKTKLEEVCQEHTRHMIIIFNQKKEVFNLCLEFYNKQSKESVIAFTDKLKLISGSDQLKIFVLNWFLKKSTKKTEQKNSSFNNIKALSNLTNFFDKKKRIQSSSTAQIQFLKKKLDNFNEEKIKALFSGKPTELLLLSQNFKGDLIGITKTEQKILKRMIEFFFDYESFSKKRSIFSDWSAYNLTSNLKVRTCLYCNRLYTNTVTSDSSKVVRPELDHFFPKSSNPILALSFYNLIPSCHVCNSNLKGKVEFSLAEYFHPYLNSFDNQNVRFAYKPKTPTAFFGEHRAVEVKLHVPDSHPLKKQISRNIKLFKLDEIYNDHVDIVHSLIELQRQSNKKRIGDIFNNILKDSKDNKRTSEQELYELIIRNQYSSNDFHKKTMAKFERDIAKELKIIS